MSLLDLAGTKASVIQMRAEAKDYVDIDALLSDGRIDLPMALAAAQAIYGDALNPQITLRPCRISAMATFTVCPNRPRIDWRRRPGKSISIACQFSTHEDASHK